MTDTHKDCLTYIRPATTGGYHYFLAKPGHSWLGYLQHVDSEIVLARSEPFDTISPELAEKAFYGEPESIRGNRTERVSIRVGGLFKHVTEKEMVMAICDMIDRELAAREEEVKLAGAKELTEVIGAIIGEPDGKQ